MTVIENRLFFDSNIWLGYFLQHEEKLGRLVDSPEGKIFTSVLCFHEVAKVLMHGNKNTAFVKEVIRFMRENSVMVELNEEIAVNAVEWRLKNNLHAIDSILYQSALVSSALFITADNDFHGLPNAQVVKV